MMKYLAALCLSLVCVAAQNDAISWKKPSFCHELDCPQYKVVNKTKDYEIRRYAASAWVGTNMTGTDYIGTGSKMFRKLFDYIGGENSEHMKIDMTAPVLRMVIPGQGPTCATTFTEHFYLSKKIAVKPPKPKDASLYISYFPEVTMYVRSFKGYDMFSEKPWLDEVHELANAIGSKASYDTSQWFTAGYDSPFSFFNRHNEVMLMKRN